jgi:hypothetical protein
VILCRKGKAEEALQRLHEIMGKLKLTVNEEKTRICKVPEGEFDFLGYSFGRMYSARTGQARLGYRPSKKSSAAWNHPSASCAKDRSTPILDRSICKKTHPETAKSSKRDYLWSSNPVDQSKGAIRSTRLSCRSFSADAVRLQLHVLAYNFDNLLRTLATPEPIKDWLLTDLKTKLIKIGAKLVSHGRYVAFQMADVAVPRMLFAEILRPIAELRARPDPAPA